MTMELSLKRAARFLNAKDLFASLCKFNWKLCRSGHYMSYQKTDFVLEAARNYEMENPDIIVNNPILYVILYVSFLCN